MQAGPGAGPVAEGDGVTLPTPKQVSIWHNVVLRGDLNAIRIGAFSTVLDGTVIHAARCAAGRRP